MVLGRRIAGVLIAAAAIAMVAIGCGGGSDSDANEAEASKTFLVKGSQNKIPKFGEEADSDEREDASGVLEENLEARAAGDWAEQCSSLTAGAIKSLEEENAERGEVQGSCAKDLAYQGEPESSTASIRENTMTGPIDALRVKGDRAWALYHGTNGKDYAMKMERSDDEWKVDSLTTSEVK
jgi:hypothetical protein